MMHFTVDAVPKDNYVLELKFRTGEVRLLDLHSALFFGDFEIVFHLSDA